MNENQQMLINLLSTAVNLNKTEIAKNENIDWNYIYEEAKVHQIHTIIYPLISELINECSPDEKLINTWKKGTLKMGALQAQNIEQVKYALDSFYRSGIKTVILKGLVLRELYPYPDLRTMSDADLLIHKEDLKKAKRILLDLGYSEGDASSRHIEFCHKSHLTIELHWAINDNYSKGARYFQSNLWDNVAPINFADIPVLSLNSEYQLIYLLLHLLEHTLYLGFGLRQLCDVALFIRSVEKTIDWDIFDNIVKQCKLDKFTKIIFSICEQFFTLDIPNMYIPQNPSEAELIQVFTDIILSGDVFGKRNASNSYSGFILDNLKLDKGAGFKSRFLHDLYQLFPSPEKLPLRYQYAKDHNMLLPAAWIHRFFHAVIGKKHSPQEVSSIFSSRASDSVKMEEFIRWLQT